MFLEGSKERYRGTRRRSAPRRARGWVVRSCFEAFAVLVYSFFSLLTVYAFLARRFWAASRPSSYAFAQLRGRQTPKRARRYFLGGHRRNKRCVIPTFCAPISGRTYRNHPDAVRFPLLVALGSTSARQTRVVRTPIGGPQPSSYLRRRASAPTSRTVKLLDWCLPQASNCSNRILGRWRRPRYREAVSAGNESVF